MASPEQIREFATLGRELGFTGGDLNGFVNARCQEAVESMRAEESEKAREHEMKMAELRSQNASTRSDVHSLHLKIGKFDDNQDKFDSYINKFELFAESQKVPDELRALYLISNLTGRALDVVNRMDVGDRDDYAKIKHELMAHYQLTEEGYRRKFRTARPEKGERPQQFATRLKGYLVQWIELSGIDEQYESLVDLILREQFMNNCSREVVAFVKERKGDTLEAANEHYTGVGSQSKQDNQGYKEMNRLCS